MDTFVSRSQKAFGKFTFAVSIAAVVVAIIGILQLHFDGVQSLPGSMNNINAKLMWRDSRRYGGSINKPKENAMFRFDLDADLTPLFNWNTKQVFTYLTVDYNTTNPKTGDLNTNSIVVWDRIIQSKDKAHLNLHRTASKYTAWDLQKNFAPNDQEVEFNLHWNVQPRAGWLSYGTVELTNNRLKLESKGTTAEN